MDEPLWISSLDLSKAFDRVNRESLWQTVGVHGISKHPVWIFQKLYFVNSVGQFLDQWETASGSTLQLACDKGVFPSPRLLSSALQWALSKRRAQRNGVGCGFQHGEVSLLDLCFGDDIVIFAKVCEKIRHIRHVGGCPHASRNCLNIDGFEDFLLGIHLFDADR